MSVAGLCAWAHAQNDMGATLDAVQMAQYYWRVVSGRAAARAHSPNHSRRIDNVSLYIYYICVPTCLRKYICVCIQMCIYIYICIYGSALGRWGGAPTVLATQLTWF
jgi:hypothetical protein